MLALNNALWVNLSSLSIPNAIVYPDLVDLLVIVASSDPRDLEVGGERVVVDNDLIGLQRRVILRVHE